MEIVLAALVAALGSVIVALVVRMDRRAEKRDTDTAAQVATNGSNKTLGELVELLYAEVRETRDQFIDHQARPASQAHRRK